MSNSYSYMNEDEIDPELFCAICQQPYEEPVRSQRCQHMFCQKWILAACLNEQDRCPICRLDASEDDYQLVYSQNLLNRLDCLLVSCDACQMENIRRKDFPSHTKNCSEWIWVCPYANLGCDWQGKQAPLVNHQRQCRFRPNSFIYTYLRANLVYLIPICLYLIISFLLFSSLQG